MNIIIVCKVNKYAKLLKLDYLHTYTFFLYNTYLPLKLSLHLHNIDFQEYNSQQHHANNTYEPQFYFEGNDTSAEPLFSSSTHYETFTYPNNILSVCTLEYLINIE